MVESVKVKGERFVFSVEKGTALPDFISRRKLTRKSLLARIDEKMWVDNSPSLKRGDSPTYTPGGFRVWSSCFPVATNVSTPQADTECPSANIMYSNLRYKKQENFVPYIPIAKTRGFTAFSGKRPIWKRTRRFT